MVRPETGVNVKKQSDFDYDAAPVYCNSKYYGWGNNIFFSRRESRTIQNTFNIKYSFTNKMGLTLNIRHYWSGVNPKELLLLNTQGYLEKTNLMKR